jgi:hypothetical protein
MANTTNFGWETPDDTDLVKDGAAAIRTLGSSIDTSFVDLKGGTTGQVLAKASNTDLDFTWSAADPLSILDAKGDLISATAADTPARLAVGTNGQVLAANSSTSTGLEWQTITGGGMTQLATGTLSGSSVDLTSISGSYKNLLLYLRNARPNTDGLSVRMRLNGVTASDGYAAQSFNGANVSETAFGASSLTVVPATDSTTQSGFTWVELVDYANSTTWKFLQIRALASGDATVTNYGNLKQDGYFNSTNAITSISIYPSSGTFNGGTYILYGVS